VLKLFRDFPLLPFILLLLSQPALADYLCDPACNLHIDFTRSGSLQAVETLTISFGSGGVINDGTVATGYSAGETLQLNAGDTLVFSAGGVLDLGDGGNIDYTAMNLIVDGDISIAALGASGTISFHGDSNSMITLLGSVALASDTSVAAQVDLSGDGVTLSSGDSAVVTVETGGIIDIGKLNLLPGASSLTLNEMSQMQSELSITTGHLLMQSDLINFEGVTFPTSDGNSCTVHDGQCFDASGTEYRADNGNLFAVDSSSGSLDILSVIFLFSMFLLLPGRRNAGEN
jgi:hypothetical protein